MASSSFPPASSTSSKVVVVFGATGTQGGSVVRSVLGDPRAAGQFSLRAVTRDPGKESARALVARGIDVVKGDLDDAASVSDVLKGAYAVFAVTDYWPVTDGEREFRQGKNVADAAKEHNVQHLIWSTLLDVNKLSNGKYQHVYHFDAKARLAEYIRTLGLPHTFLVPGFFMSNITSSSLRANPITHTWTLSMAMPATTPIPLFDASSDTGKFVKAALLKRDAVLGKAILAATAYYTPEQMLAEFRQVKPSAGLGAEFRQLTQQEFEGALARAGFDVVVQRALWESMAFIEEFGYYAGEPLDASLEILDEQPTTWKQFLQNSEALSRVD